MMLLWALLLSLRPLVCAARLSLWGRADTLVPLETVTVPLILTEDRKYLVSVNMSPGPKVQRFHFAITTGTGYSMVAGNLCDACNVIQGYNLSESLTAELENADGKISLAGHAASGNIIKEDCTLNTTNSSAPWVYPDQSIIVANETDSIFSSGMTGVFGLGTNGIENDFDSTVIAGWLSRNPTRSNLSYGMMLNGPEDTSDDDGGVLHWIQPDWSAYDNSNVVWKDMVPMVSSTTNGMTYDFHIKMDSWSLTVGNTTLSNTNRELVTFLDPFIASTIFPQTDTTLMYAALPNAHIVSNTSITNVWSVPCNSKLQVAFGFDNSTFTLDERSLIRQINGQCFGTIEEWSSSSANEYLLGSTFISKLYLMFIISGVANGSVGLAQRSTPPAPSRAGLFVGAIVGIAVGSAAFVAFVALVAFLLYRRRQYKNKELLSEHMRTASTAKETPSDFNPFLLGLDDRTVAYSPHSPSVTSSPHLSPPPPSSPQSSHLSPIQSINHTIQYSNTVVGTDHATYDPDSPPPYLTNTPTSAGGNSPVVRHQHSGEPVFVGLPPPGRKRQKQPMTS